MGFIINDLGHWVGYEGFVGSKFRSKLELFRPMLESRNSLKIDFLMQVDF